MSSTDVSKYDPEYSEQQDTTEPPTPTDPNKCLTEEDLQKKLNTGDFNKQLSGVISDATGFLNSYIKDQNNIKKRVSGEAPGRPKENPGGLSGHLLGTLGSPLGALGRLLESQSAVEDRKSEKVKSSKNLRFY